MTSQGIHSPTCRCIICCSWKVRDGGGPKIAHGVAQLHGLTVDELRPSAAAPEKN